MTEEQMQEHAQVLAAMYVFLIEDTKNFVHDPDEHNLCSAVLERSGQQPSTYFSYSNPAALKSKKFADYRAEFITGDVPSKLINRGGMQDLHTEVRLINYLYNQKELTNGTVISFFSTRSVCTTCRKAIYDTMKLLAGHVGLMAYEFKAEQYGQVTYLIYPITMEGQSQKAMTYS